VPVLDRLTREHATVAALNQELTATLERLAAAPTREAAEQLRAQLTRLADDLENHYAYEENRLARVVAAGQPCDVRGSDQTRWPRTRYAVSEATVAGQKAPVTV
jgi:hypothetical protein